jgi:hypothetical protein
MNVRWWETKIWTWFLISYSSMLCARWWFRTIPWMWCNQIMISSCIWCDTVATMHENRYVHVCRIWSFTVRVKPAFAVRLWNDRSVAQVLHRDKIWRRKFLLCVQPRPCCIRWRSPLVMTRFCCCLLWSECCTEKILPNSWKWMSETNTCDSKTKTFTRFLIPFPLFMSQVEPERNARNARELWEFTVAVRVQFLQSRAISELMQLT